MHLAHPSESRESASPSVIASIMLPGLEPSHVFGCRFVHQLHPVSHMICTAVEDANGDGSDLLELILICFFQRLNSHQSCSPSCFHNTLFRQSFSRSTFCVEFSIRTSVERSRPCACYVHGGVQHFTHVSPFYPLHRLQSLLLHEKL